MVADLVHHTNTHSRQSAKNAIPLFCPFMFATAENCVPVSAYILVYIHVATLRSCACVVSLLNVSLMHLHAQTGCGLSAYLSYVQTLDTHINFNFIERRQYREIK